MALFRETCPDIATSASKGEVTPFILLGKVFLSGWVSPKYQSLQVPYETSESYGIPVMTKRFIREAHAKNIHVEPWTVDDPELMKLANAQAKGMAMRDDLSHDIVGSFHDRLQGQGYRARKAAENVGGGYRTFEQAFSGWRDSPPHRANLLLNGATRMGIATAYSPNSKYKVFWTLILAEPDELAERRTKR